MYIYIPFTMTMCFCRITFPPGIKWQTIFQLGDCSEIITGGMEDFERGAQILHLSEGGGILILPIFKGEAPDFVKY